MLPRLRIGHAGLTKADLSEALNAVCGNRRALVRVCMGRGWPEVTLRGMGEATGGGVGIGLASIGVYGCVCLCFMVGAASHHLDHQEIFLMPLFTFTIVHLLCTVCLHSCGVMVVSRDYYYALASDREDERIKAAVQLINDLNSEDQVDEWEYAIKRLIKGLASSRASARIGFSTALTEIINIRYSKGLLSLNELISLINEHTKISSSMNGREERASLFGKLFGLQCISNDNSGILTSEKLSLEDFKLFIDNLIDLSCTKSWIREPCLFTVFNILRAIRSEEFIVYIFTKIDSNKLSLTTEGLALFLALPRCSRVEILSKVGFQNSTWDEFDPLNNTNITTLAKVLKDVSSADPEDEDNKNKKKKGSWSPRLHFVWQLIVNELTSSPTEDQDEETVEEQVKDSKKRQKHNKKSQKSKRVKSSCPDRIQVQEFWKIIIDEGFFSEKSSNERKYWGFEVFELLFKSTSTESTSCLFTQNFMRTLINHSSDSNRMLNKIAKKTLNLITQVCQSQNGKTIPTLDSLIVGPFGNLNFDRLTKSKTVESLIGSTLDNDKLADIFINVLNTRDDVKEKKWAIDQLLHLVRSKKTQLEKNPDVEWIDRILQTLIQRAYFKVAEVKEGEEDPIVEFTQERLNSILSDVISIQRTDNQTWSFKTLSSLLELVDKGYTPLLQFDEELETVRLKSLKILKKIRSKRECDHSDTSKLLVFELLFSMVILQLYSGDADSVSTLQELQDYYYKLKNNNDEDEDQQDSTLGIVEILMNFLSQKSSLLKKLSLIIWGNWCDKINLDGLQLLFDVLVTKENKEGQKALFEGEDEFVDENEEDESHDHEDEDEEESESESESEPESESEDETSNEKVAEVEKKTNEALAEALRIPHNGEVILSSDGEEDDFSDESMDDEQMMEIDGQLSKIFQQRRDALNQVQTGNKRKQEKVDAKESIVLFKHRVVDLIDIFVKNNPSSGLIVDTVSPLLKALKLTMDKSLGVKIHKLLKNRICKSKPNVQEEDKEQLLELLKSIHGDALRTSNTNDFNLSSSQCSIFIAKQIIAIDQDSMDSIIDLYATLMKHWWKKKNARLTSSIFFDFINWMNSKRSN